MQVLLTRDSGLRKKIRRPYSHVMQASVASDVEFARARIARVPHSARRWRPKRALSYSPLQRR